MMEPRTVAPAPEPEPFRPEPLALSPEQILSDEGEEEDVEQVTALSFADILAGDGSVDDPMTMMDEAQLVDPEDIAFEMDDEPEPQPFAAAAPVEMPAFVPRPTLAEAPPAPRPSPPQVTPRPAPSVAQAAPMPDPMLSADIAEQLLEPTAASAVKHAFSRLNGVSMVPSGVTIEDMMRDMLRPMLKEWLDENLPAIVERMVEKEIARVSRGVE